MGNASTTLLTVSGNSWLATTILAGDLTVTGIFTTQGLYMDGDSNANLAFGSSATGNSLSGNLGRQNTLLGINTGQWITDGSNNTCIGRLSCEALTTGDWNIMLASYSGADTITGDGNVELGGHASLYGGDNSYNMHLGFESGIINSYNSMSSYDGEYNTLLGTNTSLIPTTAYNGTLANTADHMTLLGMGSGLGTNSWVEISGVASGGSNRARVTTATAHGYSTGDYVVIRDYEPREIISTYSNADNTVCWLGSGIIIKYFRVEVVDSTHFDLDWCRASDGSGTNQGNWGGTGEATCSAWNDANYDSSFARSNGDTYSFTSCTKDNTGAFVAKLDTTIKDYDFSTVIGANAVGNCSNCVVLGRTVDQTIVNGNLVVGSGTPTDALSGGDFYVTGDTEIDGSLVSSKITQSRAFFEDEFWNGRRSEWADQDTTGSVSAQSSVNGYYRLTTGATSGNVRSMDWNDITAFINTKRPEIEFSLKLAQTSATIIYIGLSEVSTGGGDDYLDIYFDAGGSWGLECGNNTGGIATTDVGSAGTTNLTSFKMVFLTDTIVEWFIDGISQGQVACGADMPTVALQPYVYIGTAANAAKSVDLDYFRIWQNR